MRKAAVAVLTVTMVLGISACVRSGDEAALTWIKQTEKIIADAGIAAKPTGIHAGMVDASARFGLKDKAISKDWRREPSWKRPANT